VAFGGTTEGEALGQREPVTIDLGDGLRFKLRGRIDRLDKLADGTYEAVDYKTGGAFLPGGLDATFAGGRQLQHALYALAAVQLLREIAVFLENYWNDGSPHLQEYFDSFVVSTQRIGC
jgi:ATP-dependent helicase/DNAse subunit B